MFLFYVKSNNCFLFHVLQVILTNLHVFIELAGSQQTENMWVSLLYLVPNSFSITGTTVFCNLTHFTSLPYLRPSPTWIPSSPYLGNVSKVVMKKCFWNSAHYWKPYLAGMINDYYRWEVMVHTQSTDQHHMDSWLS